MEDVVVATAPPPASSADEAAVVRPNLRTRLAAGWARLTALSPQRKILLAGALAAIVALVVVAVLWARMPGYQILYANLPDKEAGVVIQTLEQMQVPHEIAKRGGAILVPADRVADVRLRLAAQGIPKNAASQPGFDLMDNQRFGISQFNEQVNYQRAVEGELAKSIESLQAVEQARVHLAFPKQTLFVRDEKKPSASVLLTLRPGMSLERSQVAAIIHLVSSSVPNLSIDDVTVLDQNSVLLSKAAFAPDIDPGQAAGREEDKEDKNLRRNQQQRAMIEQQEKQMAERVRKLVAPIVGGENAVTAEVTVEMDFSEVEQATENFSPNTAPNAAAVRSEQSIEKTEKQNERAPGGVPGALSNQPPGTAVAPVMLNNPPGAGVNTGDNQPIVSREFTRNYEVGKTVQRVRHQVGTLKRVTAAVVVNYRPQWNSDGSKVYVPLSADEVNSLTRVVQDAVGYSADRGDSVMVMNTAFANEVMPVFAKGTREKIQEYLSQHMTNIVKAILITVLLIYLMFGVVRPILRDVIQPTQEMEALEDEENLAMTAEELAQAEVEVEAEGEEEAPIPDEEAEAFAKLLSQAKQVATGDPRMAAKVIREWIVISEAERKAQGGV